jgi:hypothetical protein
MLTLGDPGYTFYLLPFIFQDLSQYQYSIQPSFSIAVTSTAKTLSLRALDAQIALQAPDIPFSCH